MKSSTKRVPQVLDQVQEVEVHEASNLKGDYGNVAILLFLYMLQGNYFSKFKNFVILPFYMFQVFHWEYLQLFQFYYKTAEYLTPSKQCSLSLTIRSQVSSKTLSEVSILVNYQLVELEALSFVYRQ